MKVGVKSERDGSIRGNLLVLTTGLASTLLVLGFPVFTTLKLVMLMAAATLIGTPLWMLRHRESRVCISALVGAGCAVGFAIIGIAGLLLNGVALSAVLLALLVLGVMSVLHEKRWKLGTTTHIRDRDTFALGAAPLLAVLPFHPKIFVFLLPLLVIAFVGALRVRLLSFGVRGFVTTFSVLGATALIVYNMTSLTRPWRDLIELDLVSDEASAFGLHLLGTSSSLTVLDAPQQGHVLAFSAFGTSAELMGLPAFSLVGAGGFAIGIFALVLTVFSFAYSSTQRAEVGWLAVTILLLQASVVPTTLVVPAMRGVNALPMLWFAVALVIAKHALGRFAVWDFTWLLAAIPVVMLGKFHWGLLLIAWVVVAISISTISSVVYTRGIALLSLVVFISAATFTLLMQSPSDDLFKVTLRGGLLLGILPVLMIRFAPALLYVRHSSRWEASMASTLIVTLLVSGGYVLLGPVYNISYLFNGIGVILALVAPVAIARSEAEGLRHLWSIKIGALAGLCGFVAGVHHLVAVAELRYGSNFDLGRLERPAFTSAFLLASFVSNILIARLTRRHFPLSQRKVLPLMVAISMSFGIFCALSLKPIVHRLSHSVSDFPREILTREQLAIGEWIDSRTKMGALLASNALCRVELQLGDPIPINDPSGRCGDRNVNAWIAATSHRAVLISAPAYGPLAFQRLDIPRYIEAYRASVSFGDSGDRSALAVLRDFGVDWFIVDLDNSSDPGWINDWAIAFQTAQFAVLDLADPS